MTEHSDDWAMAFAYREARQTLPPLLAIQRVRDALANAVTQSLRTQGPFRAWYGLSQWEAACRHVGMISSAAKLQNPSGRFWATGESAVQPRYWDYMVCSHEEALGSGRCPSLRCAILHALSSDPAIEGAWIQFSTGQRQRRCYRVFRNQSELAIADCLNRQGAFA